MSTSRPAPFPYPTTSRACRPYDRSVILRPVRQWRVEFYRLRGENPVVEELLELRAKDVRLATEVVQDLKDLEEFGLDMPEKRLHKVRGTDLWELRSRWQHRLARSLFFEWGGRLLVVTTIFQKKTQAIPKTVLKRAQDRMERWKKGRR